MYLNGLCKPLQEVLQILAKKIDSVSYNFIKYIVNQALKKEGYHAD